MPEWLSPKEAANYLGMSENWLYERRRDRKPPHYHRMGGTVRYRRDELDQWIAETRRP